MRTTRSWTRTTKQAEFLGSQSPHSFVKPYQMGFPLAYHHQCTQTLRRRLIKLINLRQRLPYLSIPLRKLFAKNLLYLKWLPTSQLPLRLRHTWRTNSPPFHRSPPPPPLYQPLKPLPSRRRWPCAKSNHPPPPQLSPHHVQCPPHR